MSWVEFEMNWVKVDGAGWSWVELGGGGWSWVEVGARFSNTQFYNRFFLASEVLYERDCFTKGTAQLLFFP